MLACFLIISQVVVIKTEQKKTWAGLHLMTVWVMKINSRRVQPQSALTLCIEVVLPAIMSAMSPTIVRGGEKEVMLGDDTQ